MFPGARILATLTLALHLLRGTHAAIGPIDDMYIVNEDVSPDGFARS